LVTRKCILNSQRSPVVACEELQILLREGDVQCLPRFGSKVAPDPSDTACPADDQGEERIRTHRLDDEH